MAVTIFRSSALLVAALLLTGCGPRTEVRQKVTLSVETPSGLKTAESVISVSYVPPLLNGPAAGFDQATITRSGEAVVMEVTPGRYLFALLKGLPDPWTVFFPNQGPQDTIVKFKGMIGETHELAQTQYPLLVTFGDISDPSSVEKVDPLNIEAAFGPGYRLIGVELALTDEPVTMGQAKKVLRWLCAYKEQRLRLSGKSGPIGDNELANNIGSGDLNSGDCR